MEPTIFSLNLSTLHYPSVKEVREMRASEEKVPFVSLVDRVVTLSFWTLGKTLEKDPGWMNVIHTRVTSH